MGSGRRCLDAFWPLMRLEFHSRWRQRRVALMGLGFIAIVAWQMYLTNRDARLLQLNALNATASERLNWLNQGERDPHGAAHHGTFLFKEVPPLAVFDFGVYPFLGTKIRLEAHKRHRFTGLPSENDVALIRSGFSTPAQVVQAVLPLMIILLGCASVAEEREQGILPMILSQGVSWRVYLAAKTAALIATSVVLSVPYWAMLCWRITDAFVLDGEGDLIIRGALLLGTTLVYLTLWCNLTIAASAWSRSPQMSLVLLLSLWSVTTVCWPPLTSNVAAMLNPLPTQEEFQQQSDRKKYDPETGENIFRHIRQNLERKLLAEYQVPSIDDLPFRFDGVVMQVAEEHTDSIYEEDSERLKSILSRHASTAAAASIGSFYVAMRTLSATLAGTDLPHHDHYSNAAEKYRRLLVRTVNKADAEKDSPEALRGLALWKSVPEFEYRPPGLREFSSTVTACLLVIAGWTVVSCCVLLKTPAMTQAPQASAR